MPTNVSLERYSVIRIADNTDDQLTPSQIATILSTAVTQEDLQTGILSQIKRIIWGNNAGNWPTDFIGAGLPSLSETQSVQGAVACIDILIGSTSPQISTTTIPAGAIITNCFVEIDSAYLTGVTITVGRAGALSLIQGAEDNYPQAVNSYYSPQRTSWGGAELPVIVTLQGNVLSGTGTVTIEYTMPND